MRPRWRGATLTKGLIGLVIPGGALVFYTLAHPRFRGCGAGSHARSRASLLLLALTAPWFVLVSRANPEFAQFFFIHEHFERFLTTEPSTARGEW